MRRPRTLTISRAIRHLSRRKVFLEKLLPEKPENKDVLEADIAVISMAIECMRLAMSYGYVVVSEEYGPKLKGQETMPGVWASHDVNQMKKTLKKLAKDKP